MPCSESVRLVSLIAHLCVALGFVGRMVPSEFLYLDIDKVRGLAAQLYEVVVETTTESTENTKEGAVGAGPVKYGRQWGQSYPKGIPPKAKSAARKNRRRTLGGETKRLMRQ